jgi:hypothetical protein
LPDGTHETLQQWAEKDGRPLADLASYLLQRDAEEWEKQKGDEKTKETK